MSALQTFGASVIGEGMLQFNFTDANGNYISVPITQKQAGDFTEMLARFLSREARTRIIVVLEEP
jgi:hypothetical protein